MTIRHYGARYRLTFMAWCYQHRADPSVIGDVARTLMADGCLHADHPRNLPHYRAHRMLRHQDSAAELEALRRAWEQYQREVPR